MENGAGFMVGASRVASLYNSGWVHAGSVMRCVSVQLRLGASRVASLYVGFTVGASRVASLYVGFTLGTSCVASLYRSGWVHTGYVMRCVPV